MAGIEVLKARNYVGGSHRAGLFTLGVLWKYRPFTALPSPQSTRLLEITALLLHPSDT